LANKMGTMVEDLVGPAFIPMAQRCFGEEIIDKAIYLRRRRKGVEGEFDIVAASEKRVYLVEVKSTVREAHIEGIIKRTIPLLGTSVLSTRISRWFLFWLPFKSTSRWLTGAQSPGCTRWPLGSGIIWIS